MIASDNIKTKPNLCRATIQIGQRGTERKKKVEGQSLHRV